MSTNFTLYSRDIVECTMYIVHRLYLLSVHGQGYIIDCTICTTYSVQIVHFTIQCTMYTVENRDLFAKCALCIHGHWIVYKLHNLYNVHCTHCITYMRLVFIKTLLYIKTFLYVITVSGQNAKMSKTDKMPQYKWCNKDTASVTRM